jgi:hypothetical protein
MPKQRWDYQKKDYSQLEPWKLAWSAAFIQAEGTLTINVSPPSAKCGSVSPRYTLWVKADNTETEPIYQLKEFFGGAVRRYQNKTRKQYKPGYRWLITSRGAADCLKVIKPYFASSKRSRLTELLLEMDEHLRLTKKSVRLSEEEIKFRNAIVSQVRQLNNRKKFGRPGNWKSARKKNEPSSQGQLKM